MTDDESVESVELSDAEKQSMCDRCGGACCSFRSLDIRFGVVDETETIREHLHEVLDVDDHPDERKGHQLLRSDGAPMDAEWRIDDHGSLFFECQHLTDDGKCGVYDGRPSMCRAWECRALQGEVGLVEYLQGHAINPGERESETRDVTEEVNDALESLPTLDA